MPHTRSAKKRLRQSTKRQAHNRAVIRDLKNQLKTVQEAAKGGDAEKLAAEVRTAVGKLDKAAQRRIVHPNLAARKKSQLYRLLNKKQTPKSAKEPG